MTLCDAGPLFALVDKRQPKHLLCRKAVTKLLMPLVTTWSCFSEVMYLTLHRGGWIMQNQIGKLLWDGMLTFYEIQTSDHRRLFELIEKYRDRPMDSPMRLSLSPLSVFAKNKYSH